MPPELRACTSCGGRIVWAVTVQGKRIPLDADPHPFGTFGLVDNKAIPLTDAMREGAFAGERYATHFITCPNAKTHRKTRAGRKKPAGEGLFGSNETGQVPD